MICALAGLNEPLPGLRRKCMLMMITTLTAQLITAVYVVGFSVFALAMAHLRWPYYYASDTVYLDTAVQDVGEGGAAERISAGGTIERFSLLDDAEWALQGYQKRVTARGRTAGGKVHRAGTHRKRVAAARISVSNARRPSIRKNDKNKWRPAANRSGAARVARDGGRARALREPAAARMCPVPPVRGLGLAPPRYRALRRAPRRLSGFATLTCAYERSRLLRPRGGRAERRVPAVHEFTEGDDAPAEPGHEDHERGVVALRRERLDGVAEPEVREEVED